MLRDGTASTRVATRTLASCRIGDLIEARGRWNGETIVDAEITLGHRPSATFPAPDGEWVRFQDHGVAHTLERRACAMRTVRAFFDQRAFLEVDTPLVVPSPGLDLHLDAFKLEGERRYLITSPEYQMKRLLAGGLPRIYQLARCFRRGEEGARHEPEFVMLEWYRAFADAEAAREDTEQLVSFLARELLSGQTQVHVGGGAVELAGRWERLTVREAFTRFAGRSMDELVDDEERFFRVLVEEIEPHLGRERALFLTRWPASMASLARLCPDDQSVADRFEAYVGGVEICNGFGELIDPVEQRARLVRDQRARREQGLADYPIDERFLGALEEGLPPCTGNALGFDRVLALLTEARSIADVIAIPRARL